MNNEDDVYFDVTDTTPFMTGFTDEEPVKGVEVDIASDLFREGSKTNEWDAGLFADDAEIGMSEFDKLFSDDVADDTEYTNENGEVFANLEADKYIIGDKEYAREDIEKAAQHYESLSAVRSGYDAMVNEVNNFIDSEVRPLMYAGMSDVESELQYWQRVKESTSDHSTFFDAEKNIQSLSARKQQNMKAYNELQVKLAKQKEKMRVEKVNAVRHELFTKNKWTESDAADVVKFAQEQHGVNLPLEAAEFVTPGLMMMMKEAMLYRKGQKAAVDKADGIVQKAITGKPTRASNKPSPNYDAARAKAMAKAKNGELSPKDMFAFLVD